MSRKRCNRRRVAALPPRGLRPMLDAGQRRDLGLVHVINLDTIAGGHADVDVLWQVVGGVLTWSHVAEALGRGVDEMLLQLGLATRLVDHYRDRGRVAFAAGDYELAKVGIGVMDALAEIVDRPTAIAAAEWSERRTAAWSAECARRAA
jgi:hypothetical protein